MSLLAVLDTGTACARANLAATEDLLARHEAGAIGPTLRFHRYRRAVLLGQSQPAAGAFDAQACARLGAEVARRPTGGGAVAMEPGILAWDLVVPRRPFPDPDTLTATLAAGLIAALAGLGVAAAFRPPGDVVAAGAKLAGTAGRIEPATLLSQGSLLVAPDTAAMAALLGRPALPIVTLAELAPVPPEPELVAALAAAFAAGLGLAVALPAEAVP